MQHASWMICATLALGGFAAAQEPPADGGATRTGAAASAAAQSSASASGTAAADAGEHANHAVHSSHAAGALASGTELQAALAKPVDAKRAKPGDEVTATAIKDIESGGQVVIPRGSRLIGRVTSAQPRGKSSAAGGADSRLGILFERAVLEDGTHVPLNATVQALAAGRSKTAAGMRGAEGSLGGGSQASGSGRGSGGGLLGTTGGVVGGIGGAVGGAARTTAGAGSALGATVRGAAETTGASAGAIGGLDVGGHLATGSKGVFGLEGLELAAGGTANAGATVITSGSRNVRLEAGTQLLLVAGAGTDTGTGEADAAN